MRRSKSAHSYTRVRKFFIRGENMAYQALYRKYRPKTFSQVVGQEHITETLKSEISEGKTVHAYLFTGTRGTGKTSCAKILARAVNCLDLKNGDPCLECESCRAITNEENTDIVEIDAASNNGIEHIRELRDQVGFAPASSKYRVYIIDEVHMLSLQAFNALLKTLEEPPEHVIFILATTEVHKLPSTILSRCQRFDFKRIEMAQISARIKEIAKMEDLNITDDAATLIAAAADGGMRDALSILDLCASGNKNIDETTVENVCAMAGNEYLFKLVDLIKGQKTEEALLLIDTLHNSSVDMLRLLSDLVAHYRDLMIVKTVKGNKKPIVCSAAKLKKLEEQATNYDIKDIMLCIKLLQNSAISMQNGNRRTEMEMAVIKLCNPELIVDLDTLERRIRKLESGKLLAPTPVETKAVEEKKELPILEEPPIPEELPVEAIETIEETKTEILDGELGNWNEILKILEKTAPLIAGVLKDSRAFIKGDFLLIDAPNSQFRSLINKNDGQYKDSIRKAAFTVLGVTYKLGPYTAASKVTEDDPLVNLANKLKNFEIN